MSVLYAQMLNKVALKTISRNSQQAPMKKVRFNVGNDMNPLLHRVPVDNDLICVYHIVISKVDYASTPSLLSLKVKSRFLIGCITIRNEDFTI